MTATQATPTITINHGGDELTVRDASGKTVAMIYHDKDYSMFDVIRSDFNRHETDSVHEALGYVAKCYKLGIVPDEWHTLAAEWANN